MDAARETGGSSLSAQQQCPVPTGPGVWRFRDPCLAASDRPRSSPNEYAARFPCHAQKMSDAEEPSTRNEAVMPRSCFLRLTVQNSSHDLRHAVPVVGFRFQFLAPRRGQAVKARLAIVL